MATIESRVIVDFMIKKSHFLKPPFKVVTMDNLLSYVENKDGFNCLIIREMHKICWPFLPISYAKEVCEVLNEKIVKNNS